MNKETFVSSDGTGSRGGDHRPSEGDAEDGADGLERRADAIRNRLRELVGELDSRRHELGRKLGGAAMLGVALAGVGIVGALVWRGFHRRRSSSGAGGALKRLVAVPRRREEPSQSLTRRLIGVAAEAAVAVASREIAKRYVTAGKWNGE